MDPSLANGWAGVVFGHALGQVFVAADTLVRRITVWRTAIQDTNYAGMKIYITETDSTGYPKATSVILNGPTVYNYYGDGIHPVPFEFVFDPPFSLPHKGQFCFAVQAVPCDATWNILSSNLDPYPGGHGWDFGRSTCFLRTSPTPYPLVDLGFAVEFLPTIRVSSATFEADTCAVAMGWAAPEHPGLPVIVYRRSASEDWGAIAEQQADVTGQIAFEDREVVPGQRYDYRLGHRQCGWESLVGETSVDIPGDFRVQFVGAVAAPAEVHLTWSLAGVAGRPVTVHRRVGVADWVAQSQPIQNQSGVLTYVDRHVTPGDEYRYRLGLNACGRELFVGESPFGVTVPGEVRLFGFRPNPADGPLSVAFSLSGTAAATLEVLDLAGRRILWRELGVMSPGSHVLPLVTDHPLAAGVYFLRLKEGSRSTTARGIVTR